jgi:acyl carrier protein
MDMENMEMKAGIIQALENAGVFVDVEEQNEINIINLIDDSIQFVSFVVQLEEIFKIELTSELLVIDNFSTIDSVCEILQALCQEKV